MPREDTQWKDGESGNPKGKPKGTLAKRSIPIKIIYDVFIEYGAEGFKKKLIELAGVNPVAYYLRFIEPLQPKDVTLLSGLGKDVESIEIKIKKTYQNDVKKIDVESLDSVKQLGLDGNNTNSKTN